MVVKNPPTNAEDARDASSIPGPGRYPEVGNDNTAGILAWKIPWTEEPDGYSPQSIKEWDTTGQQSTHTHYDKYNF